jgi:two-component system sensor histidine kinase HydH
MTGRSWIRRSWHWIGAGCGVLLGLSDYGVFILMGRPEFTPRPEVFAGALAIIFGVLGFAVGRLALARQRAARDAEIIERQLRELEEAQGRLVQQEKLAAVGRLAAGVAHEVRNPLGVIRASASMVQESFEEEDDRHRACRFICEEIDRLNSLITALLTFSRPAEPNWSQVSIDKVVERALYLAGEALRAPGVRVECETDGSVPPVRADPDLLAQVILDLLLNAADAVAGDGHILVRVRNTDDALHIDVADDGPGVAAADAAQVFEPFFTTRARGTGLGLAMARRIAETHAGTLALVPGGGAGEFSGGACFRLTIPRGPSGGEVAA